MQTGKNKWYWMSTDHLCVNGCSVMFE